MIVSLVLCLIGIVGGAAGGAWGAIASDRAYPRHEGVDPTAAVEGKSAEGKVTEGKSAEVKSAGTKATEGKAAEGKSTEGKAPTPGRRPLEAKAAPAHAHAE